ncbi:MAG: hypothetical protein ABSB87_16865 [Terriglobales bacterium]|jgi:hypothetical protein
MIPEHTAYEFTIIAIFCTVAILVFPAASGSYVVVHGPVTALQSLRAKLKLWLGMAAAARQLRHLIPTKFAAPQTARHMILLTQSDLPEQSTTLRC